MIILIGGIFVATKGLNLGIDYKAGTSITIVSDKKISKTNISDDLKKLKLQSSKIEKSSDEETTYTRVTRLSPDEKTDEIARLLGGDKVTETTRRSANELISSY